MVVGGGGGSDFVWCCVRDMKSGIEQAKRMRKESERMREEREERERC